VPVSSSAAWLKKENTHWPIMRPPISRKKSDAVLGWRSAGSPGPFFELISF